MLSLFLGAILTVSAPIVPTSADVVSATPLDADVTLVVYSDGAVALVYLDATSGTMVTTAVQDPYVISPINPTPFPGKLTTEWVDKDGYQRSVETDCKGMTLSNCVKAHKKLFDAMAKLYPKE